MRKWIAALLLASLPAPAVAQSPAPPASGSLAARIEALGPTLDGYFERYMAEQHVPGLVYGIVADGRLAYVQTRGSLTPEDATRIVTPDSLFRIASMSKAFTALAILKLRDAGRLRLDALAEDYVPELRNWRYPTSDAPRIRVRDLLSHVGGLVTDDPWGDRQQVLTEAEFTAMLRAGPPFTRAPQSQFEYSNYGYALLGRIVSNVSGRPYQDYIREEIMRPLGMAASGYDVLASPQERRALGWRWENDAFAREPDMRDGAFGAMGGVQTSARDYARWAAFLLAAWPPRDGAEQGPVRRSTVRELGQGLNFVAVARRPGDPESCPQAAAYGMGFRVAQDCDLGLTLAHGGGYPGYGSYLLLLPDHGVAVFAFANRTYAGPSPPVWQAALALHRAGLLTGRAIPVSEALAANYRAAGAMWTAGTVEPGRRNLAMNFLLDRSAENWASVFTQLKAQTGTCRTDGPLTATGAMAGNFTWTCERGTLQGQLLLAPTSPPTIQALRFRAVPDP
ncbi:MAG TPA: serine hydrolase domain-containing protein [Allosphingosinicella sp.]|nr:serine hydrolase domain-containing protein [Allosphingosinicella sp.]